MTARRRSEPDGEDHAGRSRLHLLAGLSGLVLASVSGVAAAQQSSSPPQPDSFRSLMGGAMTRMDRSMAVPYSGDPDRDFAAMMIAHHQGAIDMAELELRFGHDERLRRLAQGIIVEQQQEIAVMRQVLAELPPSPTPSPTSSPTSGAASPTHDMSIQSKEP